ncbi:MAG: SMC-Scp complex subunit ScpB [Cytophagales bacterium]|nr:SMC-Scp complex subunit ScpB [Cytophagales bacterium]
MLERHIEALIFSATSPISKVELQKCLSDALKAPVNEAAIEEALTHLLAKYEDEQYSFQIFHLGGGYQFLTKASYQPIITSLLKQYAKKRLSTATLETLAIITYKQPITKTEIEQIRGVGCDYTIQKLLEKELIQIKGKAEALGKPILYGTSPKFLAYLGINDLKDLPTPKDFSKEYQEIGQEKKKGYSLVLQ